MGVVGCVVGMPALPKVRSRGTYGVSAMRLIVALAACVHGISSSVLSGPSTTQLPSAAGCKVRGPQVDLHGCDLINANLTGADLNEAVKKQKFEADFAQVRCRF